MYQTTKAGDIFRHFACALMAKAKAPSLGFLEKIS